jgi:hypothetical protein
MITHLDSSYQETKRLKQNGAPLPSPFRELAEWITAQCGIKVLNIRYETVIPDHRPRLEVIYEPAQGSRRLDYGKLADFNRVEDLKIIAQFQKLLTALKDHRFNTERLFVIFSAFDLVAHGEAASHISEAELETLKNRLGNKDLWKISLFSSSATFFFYTDAQVKKYEDSGLKETYAIEYYRLLGSYDEFGYVQSLRPGITFDSKENFDLNYQGSWLNYYR